MSENLNNNRMFGINKNIDTRELILAILKRWYILVTAIIASFLISLIYTTAFVTPMYSSVAKVIVFNKQQTTSANDLELSSSLYLAKDFKEIITDKMILSDVSASLDNKYSIGQLQGFINIENPQNTRIIQITALTPDPLDSKKIVDTVCEVSQEKLVELMGLDRITLISGGDVAKSPSHPNKLTNLALGALIGLVIGCFSVFIIYILDNKVTTAIDVEKIFGMSVLATIPYNNKQKTRK